MKAIVMNCYRGNLLDVFTVHDVRNIHFGIMGRVSCQKWCDFDGIKEGETKEAHFLYPAIDVTFIEGDEENDKNFGLS